MASNLDPPIYDELPPDGRYTRIMSLQAGVYDATLSCTIRTTSLETVGKYEALSYTWGRENPVEEISYRNSTMPLQPNLAAALRRLRSTSSGRDLWIDYLCINQQNEDERVRQLQYVHKLYEGADQVIGWLGEENETSNRVMDYIAELNPENAIQEANEYVKTGRIRSPTPNVLAEDDIGWTEAIDSFLSRPWFRRVWIQQEAVMCHKTTILCGTKSATWDQLFAFAWKISKGGDLTPTVARHWRHMSEDSKIAIKLIRTLQIVRKRHTAKNAKQSSKGIPNKQKPTLLFILESARLAQAKYDVDKIYGLQHLANLGNEDEMKLIPTKGAQWQTVYKDLVQKYLNIRGSVILSYAGRAIQKDQSLPSWVPDWRYEKSYRMHSWQWKAGGPEESKPGPEKIRGVPVKHKWEVRFSPDGKILSISALHIGKIMRLSSFTSRDIDSTESHAAYAKFEKSAFAMIDENGTYPNEETQFAAYAKTLVANNPQDYSLMDTSDPNFLPKFRDWREWLHRGSGHEERPKYDVAIENTGTFVHRQLGFTDGNLMCLVPAMCNVGDKIFLIRGLDRPMVVRARGETHEFIGECYVHGVMYGEKWKADSCAIMDFI